MLQKRFRKIQSQLFSKLNSNLVLSVVAMVLNAFVILSITLTCMTSRPIMMQVGIHSIQDVEISNVMYLTAEAYGVDKETFRNILEDDNLKQIMVSASVERIEALLMRRDSFTSTSDGLKEEIKKIILAHTELDDENLDALSQYIFYLTGTQTVATDITPEEYRHSAYVLGEKLEEEDLVEMDDAYSILAFLTNGQVAALFSVFWMTFLVIILFLGRKNMGETVRGLFYKHYPVAILGVAVSIGVIAGNWDRLGIVFQTFFVSLLVISVLFFAVEALITAVYFKVIHHKEAQEIAEEKLKQIRRPYVINNNKGGSRNATDRKRSRAKNS